MVTKPRSNIGSTQAANIHPEDAIAASACLDVINTTEAHTLDELFRERVRRSPDKVAYLQYDYDNQVWQNLSWAVVAEQVSRWQAAFREQGLVKGDRVAICLRNGVQWIVFDQAASRVGLVVVEPEQWSQLCGAQDWDANTANTLLAQEFVLQRIAAEMDEFPGYAKVRQVHISLQEWTIEAGLLTPTLKVKRAKVVARFDKEIAQLYAGYGVHKS